MSFTTDKNDPSLHETRSDGQNKVYLILSEEERAKGFVRPLRTSYIHKGRKIEQEGGKIRPITEEEERRYAHNNYAYFLEYPEDRLPILGKFLTEEEYKNMGKYTGGCGTLTTMAMPLAETYARDPKFYSGTFCTGCGKHLPVDEFVWDGTDEKVGS